MSLDLLGQITGVIGFVVIMTFGIYKYTTQNKEFESKK